jgi:hypothetical protein
MNWGLDAGQLAQAVGRPASEHAFFFFFLQAGDSTGLLKAKACIQAEGFVFALSELGIARSLIIHDGGKQASPGVLV